MTLYAYDLECYPNLFTATFVNIDDETEEHVFCIGLGHDDTEKLKVFLDNDIVLVGYNCKSYDDPMLRYVIDFDKKQKNSAFFKMSSMLVNDVYRSEKEILALRYPRDKVYRWSSIDLMTVLAFDQLGISLKQTAINLKWKKIQDLPFRPSDEIRAKDLDTVIQYNLNDVLITKKLYEEITPLLNLRRELTSIYSVDLISASDSKMANLILEHIYSSELKRDIRSIRKLRTPRRKVLLGSCVAKFVQFNSPELKEMLNRIKATYVYDYNNYKYNETLYYGNLKFSLGVGGLHTEDGPGKFESDDKYLIQDMDVASYYPNLIINNNFYPQHLGPDFIKVLKKITKERLDAKHSGDKVKADGLKITINSIFGKLGSQHFWLYDPKQFLSTTISGQMGLLMLVEGMIENGIEVISCNTDGVVCRIDRNKLDLYYSVAEKWEQVTGLTLEYTPYKKYIRRDVNAYITEKPDGTTKEKGIFIKKIDLKKAYHMPIVAKALYSYFILGKPIRETVRGSKDIMDFCISQKTGSDFVVELHTTKKVESLQKTNRFYISTKGGALIKRDYYGKRKIGLYVGKTVQILNDYDEKKPFDEYDVDYSFYEKEIDKIINDIEPPQLTMFDFSDLDTGSKTKMEIPKAETSQEKTGPITLMELNKLGKNQLLKKIEDIVKSREKILEVNPRYVYVMDVNTRNSEATFYCLQKGTVQTLSVSKDFFRKNIFSIGELLYCDKFEKENGNYTLTKYHKTNHLKQINTKLI